MTGAWTARAATAVAGAVVSAVGIGAAPAAAAGEVSCAYTLTSVWPGGFSANLAIANAGPTVDGWTARWNFAEPTGGIQGWGAWISQQGAAVTATNTSWDGVIGTGRVVSFGWTATAATTSIPTGITVNGVPC